jgi:hypothetical protein
VWTAHNTRRLLLGGLLWRIGTSDAKGRGPDHAIKLILLTFTNFLRTMILYELIYSEVTTTNSNDDLIFLKLNKQTFFTICIDTLRFPNEQHACFLVCLVVVDVVSKLAIYGVILNGCIYKVSSLKINDVFLNPL